jgi:hypothetical protein
VGTIARPVTAQVLQLFNATAYFMVHGNGIPDFPLGPLQGFSIATGFHVSFTWGNTSIGLYLRVAAGFDAGIGFAPLFFAGRVYLEGELHLFILGLAIRAELSFASDGEDTRLEGRICGKIDLFFFSIRACVRFALGNVPGAPFPPPPIRDLKLQSRSPALVDGTGVDRGIDTVLCRGTADGSVPVVEVREGDEVVEMEVFVPIDTIPLIQFEVAPEVPSDAMIDGQLSSGLPPGFGEGWQKRGPNYLRYRITSIELRLVAAGGAAVSPGTPATTEGPRPYTWRHGPQLAGSDGLPVELALLDWKPTNSDKVRVQGPALDGDVDGRWSRVCDNAAEPARVLWTFQRSSHGPSPAGWRLAGQPWPDPPGTRRSRPVPAALHAGEIWRTGSFVDALLPGLEAEVVGAPTKCPGKSRLRRCVARVLEAPYEMLAESLAPALQQELGPALFQLDSTRREDLRDVVRLTGGPFVELRLLIFARIRMVESRLLKVRAFRSRGVEIAASATFQFVAAAADLPGPWLDGAGPWWEEVALAHAYFSANLARPTPVEWGEYLVKVELAEPALIVDIGISPLFEAIHGLQMEPPSWFLAVIEGLSSPEVRRHEEDRSEAEDDRAGLAAALDDQTHALLLPNARYEVRVQYTAEVGQKPVDPAPGQDPNEIVVIRTVGSTSDVRTFFTDAEPPRNLDPWMLVQFPSPGEGYHFTDDPVVIVFATDDVLELFGAYDRELRVVARAASFRGSANTPDAALTHLLLRPRFEPIGGVVLSPWEATVRRRIGPEPCANFNPDADRHGRVTLPFLLDPLTDYALDLEALNPAGEVVTPARLPSEVGDRPLYRHLFTTSRYRNREELADSVRQALPVARTVSDATPLEALEEQVNDAAFDLALHGAGLEVTARPVSPAVTVLWSADAPARAIGVLIETPEPLWRTRLEPRPEYDESGVYIRRWVLAPVLWLVVDELVRPGPVLIMDGGPFVRRDTGTAEVTAPTITELRHRYLAPRLPEPPPFSPPPASLVSRLVHDEGGTRTLVLLAPGSRGSVLSLGLARNLHPLLDADATDSPVVLLEIELGGPPWEEV